ncbi:MAG: hypothetical protein ACTHOG_05455 [Marmoricola sp.]
MGDRRLFRGTKVRTEEGSTTLETVPLPDQPPAIPPGSPQAVDASCVRSLLTVQGVISEVSLGSRGDAPALEASMEATNPKTGDQDRLVLVWLGRTEIAGIHPGREIVATARICDEDGSHVMYNPRYDLR